MGSRRLMQTVTTTVHDGIMIARIDAPGEKVNTLNKTSMAQFESVISEMETQASLLGLILISGKPDNFIAGADITMLDALHSAAEMTDLARQGQTLMDRLARIPKPVVAAINGACLGGGLEVALACSYRIATSASKTKLGLPEVMLGLLPGSGGTQRLPRLVGIQEAVSLMTTGKTLSADRAKKAGLIHEVVDPAALETVALQAARELIAGSLKPSKRKPSIFSWLLEGNPLGRMVLWNQAEKAINKAAGGHYPAPLAILESIKAGVEQGHTEGSKTEARLFGELGMTPVSRALRGVFHAQTATKKNPFGKPTTTTSTVGVLGAGLMGAGISQVTAVAGICVVLKDRDAAAIARGEGQISGNLASSVKKKRMTQFDKDRVVARVVGVSDADESWRTHLGRADVIVEAVFEDLSLKHRVIKEIEPLMKPGAVFASNTSALPLSSIATAANDPSRVLGMHYFSPVDKMPLLEIIPHAGTSPAALAVAYDLGLKQGKTVIVVKDVPGFYVNRSLAPWATEALLLVQEGVEPEALDNAVRKFGYPVGPVTLADEVGIDVLSHTYATMKAALGVRMAGGDDAWLKQIVERKFLGRKTGKGFYLYEDSKGGKKGKSEKKINEEVMSIIAPYIKQPSTGPISKEEMLDRMVFRFMKECMHSLEDGIIKSAADGDIGAIFGLGFPPFLGGPFRYADTYGARRLADDMSRYASKLGPQFDPPSILVDHANKGTKFYK